MTKVENQSSLHLITKRFLKMNKHRNIISICAIILTTVMFSVLFIAGLSIFKSSQEQMKRNTMSTSHIDIKDLTKAEFKRIISDSSIKKYGYTIYLTTADNEKLKTSQTEIRYANFNGAKSFMSYPTTGHMPKNENEIALSTITLDFMGIPHKIGEKVNLQMTLSGKKINKEFTLCGYWKGDSLFLAQEGWVSQLFCTQNAKQLVNENRRNGDIEGGYDLSLWVNHIFRLEKIVQTLDKKYGISKSGANISLNPAYDYFDEDSYSYIGAILALLVIFLSGYLIIYNVFQMSVKNDIKAYGQLKNIGATGRQLKRIVLNQALYLCLIAIPIGILIGYFAGKSMTPYLIPQDEDKKMQIYIMANPVIMILSAMFSMITVYIACLKPSKIVKRLTPIEALKYQENSNNMEKIQKSCFLQREDKKKKQAEKISKELWNKKVENSQKISLFKFAFENIKRNKLRFCIVIVSLMLPIIILNCIYIMWRGYDFNKYIAAYISSDFNISGATSSLETANLKAISPEFQKALEQRPEVKNISKVYNTTSEHTLAAYEKQNLLKLIGKLEEKKIHSSYDMQKEKDMLNQNQRESNILGITKGVFNKLQIFQNQVSWEKFNQGNYVIIESFYHPFGELYHTGDLIKIEFPNNVIKQYTVLANASMPYDLDYPYGSNSWFSYHFILPEREYVRTSQNSSAMVVGINVKKNEHKTFKHWLETYIKKGDKPVYITSRDTLKSNCESFASTYYIVLGSLGIIIFLIGILNFFNTISMSVVSRRNELALFEAIGMTKRQMKRMLIYEGMIYLMTAFMLANTIGIIITSYVVKSTIGSVFYFTYHFSLIASICAFPALLLIAVVIPVYHYRKMMKYTVVERICYEE